MRLPGYDYRLPGHYFVTICTKNRQSLFGSIDGERLHLNSFGRAVENCWLDLPRHYRCTLDAFVVMPNHVHGVIIIPDAPRLVGAGLNPRLRDVGIFAQHPLTEIARGFKTFSAAAVNRLRQSPGATLWQRSFPEHILRTEHDLERVRAYIRLNPERWDNDTKNPDMMVKR